MGSLMDNTATPRPTVVPEVDELRARLTLIGKKLSDLILTRIAEAADPGAIGAALGKTSAAAAEVTRLTRLYLDVIAKAERWTPVRSPDLPPSTPPGPMTEWFSSEEVQDLIKSVEAECEARRRAGESTSPPAPERGETEPRGDGARTSPDET